MRNLSFSFKSKILFQTYVSNKRLQHFFKCDELDSTVIEKDLESPYSAEMENFTAAWDKVTEENKTLSDISLPIVKGELLAVVGKVGSGKSSLLNALLGNFL